jgi:hypothetical protein
MSAKPLPYTLRCRFSSSSLARACLTILQHTQKEVVIAHEREGGYPAQRMPEAMQTDACGYSWGHDVTRRLSAVRAGLVPAIHATTRSGLAWMPATSAGMTR